MGQKAVARAEPNLIFLIFGKRHFLVVLSCRWVGVKALCKHLLPVGHKILTEKDYFGILNIQSRKQNKMHFPPSFLLQLGSIHLLELTQCQALKEDCFVADQI